MNFTLWILLIGWIFVVLWVPIIIYTNKGTHPKALFILFFAEMWERFSYYGMRALLVLYMTKVLFVDLGGVEADTKALGIYGSYTSLVYLLPVLGGLIADRVLGFRRAVIWGGALMMLGHFALAAEGMAFEGNLILFFISLSLIIVGNGFFKPNISSFLGTFYDPNDARKDGAFTIFYMGVNIGAFLSTLTCGYVGEEIGWHYGFGLAGIGMAIGLLVFWFVGPRYFGNKGLMPDEARDESGKIKKWNGISWPWLIYIGSLVLIALSSILLNFSEVMTTTLLVIAVGIIGFLIYNSISLINRGRKADGQRLLVVIVLFFFHAIFWALFEQAGGSLTLFTDRNVDRMAFGAEVPASIYQSLNPLYIILLAPFFSWLWIKLRRSGNEPSTPMKFVLGLIQLALGFLVIALAAKYMAVDGRVSMIFLALMYLLHTTGELSLSPVGLSMVTKLSPAKIVGFVMGAWFLSIALASKMAGEIGKLTAASDLGDNPDPISTLHVYSDTYLIWGVFVVFGSAVLLLFLVPTLRRWMHGIH